MVDALRDRRESPDRTAAVRPERAVGRVLAAPVTARRTVPPAARATTDGYALDAADTHRATARSPATVDEFARVTAGDAVPDAADAVVPGTDADPRDDALTVHRAVTAGENVVAAGATADRGDVLSAAGHRVRPTDLPLLRAAGPDRVQARGRPHVAVAGDDALAALVERWGATVTRPDALSDAPRADLYVAAGDDAPAVDETIASRVALSPGGTAAAGSVDGVPAVRVPSPPGPRLVAAAHLVRPVVSSFGGEAHAPAPARTATLRTKLPSEPRTVTVARVTVAREEGDAVVDPVAVGDGIDARALAAGDGWVTVSGDSEGVPAGDRVTVERWDAS